MPSALDILGGHFIKFRKIKFGNESGAEFAAMVRLNFHSISSTKTGVNRNLLPLGIAYLQAMGGKQYGTTNITTSWVRDHYVIHFTEFISGTIPVSCRKRFLYSYLYQWDCYRYLGLYMEWVK